MALAVQLGGPHASLIRAVTMLVVVSTTFVLGGTTKFALDCFQVPTGVADDPGEEAERRAGGGKSLAQAVDDWAAEVLLDHELNKMIDDGDFEDIEVGATCFMLNPQFIDGTRLRLTPEKDAIFSGHILNDTRCEVLDIADGGYALVRSIDTNAPAEGWVRRRNLTMKKRALGLGLGRGGAQAAEPTLMTPATGTASVVQERASPASAQTTEARAGKAPANNLPSPSRLPPPQPALPSNTWRPMGESTTRASALSRKTPFVRVAAPASTTPADRARTGAPASQGFKRPLTTNARVGML